MAGPSWVASVLAAVMIVVAVYCTGRLVASRRWRRPTAVDADGLHLVMGVAMAGMLVPALNPLPADVWEGMFGVAAAWFALQAARAGSARTTGGWLCHHPVPHLVECGAMLYMLLAAPGTPQADRGAVMPMPAMSGPFGKLPALALVLALFMLGYVVWATDRLTSRARARTATPAQTTDHTRVLIASGAAASSPDTADPPGAPGGLEHPPAAEVLAPRLAESYKIAMGIVMGYMLVLMV